MAPPIDMCALQAMCKDKGLKAGGKREELLARLQEADKGAEADGKEEKKTKTKKKNEEQKEEEKTTHHAPSGLKNFTKRELQVRFVCGCINTTCRLARIIRLLITCVVHATYISSLRMKQKMCEEQGLRPAGTKEQLTARLLAAGAPGSDAAASADLKDAIYHELKVSDMP